MKFQKDYRVYLEGKTLKFSVLSFFKNKRKGIELLDQKIEDMANELIEWLKARKIVVQLYKSKRENSICLKLDYGVLNSIKITEKEEQKDLHYKYNIVFDLLDRKVIKIKSDYGLIERHFFPFKEKEIMIEQILEDRKRKKKRYGKRYSLYMKKNKEKYADQTYWKVV